MPRAKDDKAKTSQELDAEIKAMQEKIAAKKKAFSAAKKQEDQEAAQAREYEEIQFNREIVEVMKAMSLGEFGGMLNSGNVDLHRTIYDLLSDVAMKRRQ